TDLFERKTIERWLEYFERILKSVAAEPQSRLSQWPLLGSSERHQLLEEWNETSREYASDRCLHELFTDQASRRPDAVAVVNGSEQMTYGELERRSNQLAHYLRSIGVGP